MSSGIGIGIENNGIGIELKKWNWPQPCWMINNFISNSGATYIRGLIVYPITRLVHRCPSYLFSGLILSLRPANERRRYKVTPPLTGWAQTIKSALYSYPVKPCVSCLDCRWGTDTLGLAWRCLVSCTMHHCPFLSISLYRKFPKLTNSMTWFKTAITPLLKHWSYCSLALSHPVLYWTLSKTNQCNFYKGLTIPSCAEIFHKMYL